MITLHAFAASRSARLAFIVATMAASTAGRAQGLDASEKDTIKLVERVRPTCVLVRVQDRAEPAPNRKRIPRFVNRTQLSGTAWDSTGTFVTLGADLAHADRVFITFHDGSEFRATIVAEDTTTSIGVLKIEGAPVPVSAVTWGDSKKLVVGNRVIAVGCPFGFTASPSFGWVSGLDRELVDPNAGSNTPGLIQVTTSVNPGDTGGPLANSSGEIVGLLSSVFRRPTYGPSMFSVLPNVAPERNAPETPKTWVFQDSLSAEGIGFAYPAHLVRPAVEKLLKAPNVKPAGGSSGPWLGITVEPIGPALAAQLGISEDMVLVDGVTRNGPAGLAGIQKYDVLVSLDGKEIPTQESLMEVLGGLTPGADVKAAVRRQGQTLELNIKLER
ncbi:MAG: trypsin-like peptidase domain-containing protein [Planctomycetes bacterium]|nr:trypsin-like peptidase domain-containing protein [Planctomycetota bacterium]